MNWNLNTIKSFKTGQEIGTDAPLKLAYILSLVFHEGKYIDSCNKILGDIKTSSEFLDTYCSNKKHDWNGWGLRGEPDLPDLKEIYNHFHNRDFVTDLENWTCITKLNPKNGKTIMCLKCDSENFENKIVEIKQDYKGKPIYVNSEATVCTECNSRYLTAKQMNKVLKLVRAAIGTNTDTVHEG